MIEITRMAESHIDQVYEIELTCFSIPWTKQEFFRELANKHAFYVVALENGAVVGYGGMWHIINEAHITNIAVGEICRGQGVGRMILNALIDEAEKREMIGLTLEVRVTNAAAKALYEKAGFTAEGIRPGYYADTREDAIIMWKHLVSDN